MTEGYRDGRCGSGDIEGREERKKEDVYYWVTKDNSREVPAIPIPCHNPVNLVYGKHTIIHFFLFRD